MSTVLQHPQRSHLIAATAAVTAVAGLGVVFGISQHDAPASTGDPTTSNTVPHFRLTGGNTEVGSWHHAGTTSGGRIQLGP
jgi:hypothetical protein